MHHHRSRAWPAVPAPALVCLPCVLAPALVAGGAALVAAAASAATGRLLAGVVVLLLGGALAGARYRHQRRATRPTRSPAEVD